MSNVQKMLKGANNEIGGVVSDVFCVLGRSMLAALHDRRITAEHIADLAKREDSAGFQMVVGSMVDHRSSDH